MSPLPLPRYPSIVAYHTGGLLDILAQRRLTIRAFHWSPFFELFDMHCMDAPEVIPAGSTSQFANVPVQNLVVRGF